jgi:hypothetical protein
MDGDTPIVILHIWRLLVKEQVSSIFHVFRSGLMHPGPSTLSKERKVQEE